MTARRLVAPPGPKGFNVVRFFGGGSFARTLAYLEEVARGYGPIASFTVFRRRLHLVTGAELVRQVLVVQQSGFGRANGAEILRDLLGHSMLTVDEPLHREQRRLVQPAFHAHRIRTYSAAMVEATQLAIERWSDGESIDLSTAMTSLALVIVGRALFGSDVRESVEALERSLTPAMRVISWVGPILEALPPQTNALRLRLPLSVNAVLAKAKAELESIVGDLIAKRRATAQRGDDLLTALIDSHDADGRPLDTQSIAAELATILLAGHETTANALAWALLELARDPALQARVQAEIAHVLADADTPAVTDVSRLSLTAAVFSEALRLYPPASAFGRRALRSCELGGFRVRAGDGILLSPYVSHRNPAYFPDPHRFVPDRWANADVPPFAYFPFGGGSRVCIGESFARMEGTLVLATILRRFRLTSPDNEAVTIGSHATLRPSSPIVVRLNRRVHAPSRSIS